MEWWWSSGEEELQRATRKVPPPPPPYAPHEEGVQPPNDRALCPLCQHKRSGPTMIATSGYVFCYKCIFPYVNEHGRCPVTYIRASLNDIRRLML